MHAAKFAFSFIAETLGTTRNSVIGKAHRMALNGKVYTPKPRKKSGSGVNRVRASRPRPRVRVMRQVTPPPPPPEPIKPVDAWSAIPGTTPVGIMDLNAGMCKWPIGEGRPFLFCGCPAGVGASYCESHQALSKGPGTPSERRAKHDMQYMAKRENTMMVDA
jgi:GcrA cell cycle regulator